MIATTQRTLHEGARNAVVQITGISDGADNETNVSKIATADFGAFKISKITYATGGAGGVNLLWGGIDPVVFLSTAADWGQMDHGHIGGLRPPADSNGDVLLTTTGFENGSSYTIALELKKKHQ